MSTSEPRCCRDVVESNSARSWSRPSEILVNSGVIALLDSLQGGRALEVGAGGLRNALFLLKRRLKVDILDPFSTSEQFAKRYRQFLRLGGSVLTRTPARAAYDVVVATYVLETICCPSERANLVAVIAKSLKVGGCWLLSVRGPRNIVLAGRGTSRCSDGYVTSQRTFVRSFTPAELRSLLRPRGFRSLTFLHKASTAEPELLHVIARRATHG